ncbi:unnamed protein product, partial [Durusdinium trenchii]
MAHCHRPFWCSGIFFDDGAEAHSGACLNFKFSRDDLCPVPTIVFLKASSVHEKGLHGQVRNLNFDPVPFTPRGEEDRPPMPFSAGMLEASDGQVLERDDKASTPKAGDSIGATPVVLGLPITDRSERFAQEFPVPEDHPRSPQCMAGVAQPSMLEAIVGAADDEVAQQIGEPMPEPMPESMKVKQHAVLSRGPKLWCQQFDALFRKRALSIRRDRRAWASQLLLPAIF